MNRKLIGVTTLVTVILAVMLVAAVLMGGFQRRYQAARAIEVFRGRLAIMDAETLHKHRMLARWYNYCLGAKEAPAGYEEAYKDIWNVSDGMMGYISLQEGQICIPIHHNASVSEDVLAAGHVPGSALPVGGRGNHTVLIVPEEAAELREGDVFSVHIPGDVLRYCVREIKVVSPGRTDGVLPVEGEDLCTLSVTVHKGTDTRKILIYGVRAEEELKASESIPDRRTLYSVLWWVLGTLFLPKVTGGIGWKAEWAFRKWNCKRLTKNMR